MKIIAITVVAALFISSFVYANKPGKMGFNIQNRTGQSIHFYVRDEHCMKPAYHQDTEIPKDGFIDGFLDSRDSCTKLDNYSYHVSLSTTATHNDDIGNFKLDWENDQVELIINNTSGSNFKITKNKDCESSPDNQCYVNVTKNS